MEESPSDTTNIAVDHDSSELAGRIEPAGTSTDSNITYLVGLGGSAGSIAAMQRFFRAMPPDSGMAFVVILHLSPEHDSVLSDILQQTTSMNVAPAVDGALLEPNHVYVIPPGKQLSIVDGHLGLSELAREPGRRVTVDLFFRSLADTHGPQSVAIVLSGGDGDGAVGIKRIKERGGLTIAQDPEDAEHEDIPRAAIATGMVDWVLRAEDMPARLLEYQAREHRLAVPPERGPNPALQRQPSSDDEAALRDVLNYLRSRTGRDFSYYKRGTIVRRVARRMQVNEVDDLRSYLRFLRAHPGESGALLHDLLISVTNFFRDREAFEALEAEIPGLFKDKSQSDTVRVWVPACATGEEAYSIAMLLSEHARTLEAPPILQVFATDLDEDVLTEARSGLYPAAIAADVSAERLQRFFIKAPNGHYRVGRDLRELLLFAVHDLLKDSPFSRLDLLSCRNLLIYLNRGAQQRVFDIFHFALRPDGRLFLGTSEAADDASPLFTPVDKKHHIYAARATARTSLPVPTGQSTLARSLHLHDRGEPGQLPRKSPNARPLADSVPRATGQEHLSWSELHLKLIERFAPPSLLVNGDHEILHLSERAGPFLQFAGGEPTANLLRVVHPALRIELRAALSRARQTGEAVSVDGIAFELQGQRRVIEVQVSPALDISSDFLLVTFILQPVDATPAARPRPYDEPLAGQLERELELTKRHLRDMVEEHEASVEELKASNEELQAMNEELRSATEELESSREELQSINEELTTVNQELKLKVDELGHSNSDLHNLMGATAIATVFLDRDLRIMRFTPPAVGLFNVIATDVGRPLADLQHRLEYPQLLTDAATVLQSLVPVEREVSESGGRYFLARLLPYRTTDDRIAGVVLTFIDVTERQQANAAVELAQQQLEARVQERTAELDSVNAQLRREIAGHQQARSAQREAQRRLVNAQEEERRRISRELHDEVSQHMTGLMLGLKALEDASEPADISSKLREVREITDNLGREIHQLAIQLRPVMLDELGLARALTGGWQARTGISLDFVSTGIDEARLPSDIETTLYRVVQEALNNVYKHSAAKNVSISIERKGDIVLAIVEDDGDGFDVEKLHETPDTQRIGITGMRERVALVGGELTIESALEHGTTVRVKLPLKRELLA